MFCRWCGSFFKEATELTDHEAIHRSLDSLGGHFNNSVYQKETQGEKETTQSVDRTEHQGGGITFNLHWEVNNSHNETQSINDGQRLQSFRCSTCSKDFKLNYNKIRHEKTCQAENGDGQNKIFRCSKCSKDFNRLDNKTRHGRYCSNIINYVCTKCNIRCSTSHGLRRHLQWHEKAPTKRPAENRKRKATLPAPPPTKKVRTDTSTSTLHCRRCTAVFNNRHDLYLHRMNDHYQTGSGLQRPPWSDGNAPWIRDGRNDGLREVYQANAPLILEAHQLGPVHSVYNFPLDNNVTENELMRFADYIYQREQRAFRLNIVFGSILQHRETGEYRYFVAYNNNGIFERPLYVSRRQDLARLRLRLRNRDILTALLRHRPDTKWIPVLVTNVHFDIYSTHYPLGRGDLPNYLMKKKSIYPLVRSRKTGRSYDDDLCVFRCLSLHRGYDIKSLEKPAKEFYHQWLSSPQSGLNGLAFEDFPAFEKLFNVNLEVYSLKEDGFAQSVYKSKGQQGSTMYLNVYENHLSYIRDFASYAEKYRCKTCDRHFRTSQHLHRHQKICINKTKYIYPGGFYQSKDSIFEQLDHYGINVPEDQRTFPWFLCYDFEAILQKICDQPTEYLQWTHKHIPISVSICSNVEGHSEAMCIVEPDQDQLVEKMIEVMTHIATSVYELAEAKWGWVLEAINTKLMEEDEFEEELEEDNDDEEEEEKDKEKKKSHPLKTLYGYFKGYMSQVPVIGFNSAKYDLNLVRKCLAKHLRIHESGLKHNFVVKKNNAYACIATDDLKLLDMSQFLAAGASYAGFLKAYQVEEQKGFFPYEWFDDVNKLEDTKLPSYDAFYSTLKGSNISPDDYEYCQNVWKEQKMSTFKEFLIWYNNLDVGPFVKAVERFQAYYFEKGIDVFKTSISVPGIARQLLFRSAKQQNATFALFDKENADLYKCIKRNIIGGPSIIFTRHHEVGETRIHGNKLCGSILGFDANALYLEAIGKPMPVGPFIRRRAINDFRPEARDKYMSAYYWMDWLIHTLGLRIKHKLNFGKEVRIGKYPVDGYCSPLQPGGKATVFQFHGCYWHSHLCDVTKRVKDEKWWRDREQKFQETLETTAYIKQRGFNVIEMWECEFRQYCRENPQIYNFIDSKRPGFFQQHKGKITEDQILEGVVKDQLFGMVEVDIEVPKQWPSYFDHPTMTPYQYFREMSPLFCTTDIPYEVIGKHMQDHIEKYNLSKHSRRLLVGGMKGRDLLIATPLLQWYLNHGMVVTKIHQVVEFQQQRCFKEFVREVSDARRMGDRDPSTAIIADTKKVIGNASYGSLIMDKTKHRDIKYVQGENETCLKINDPCFCKLECLDDEDQYYEMEMAKKVIRLDLPIQLGYFILQYAKLRMLEFYYDFMDVYVERQDFEYCEMDTDSAYMAISGSSLENVIKPNMKDKYQRGLKGFCTNLEIEADTGYHWFPRTCCREHASYDKRTPGLFKLEYQGDEMISLCSKTYIVRSMKTVDLSTTVDEYKFSSKGVSKKLINDPMTKFRNVLSTSKPQSGINRGFRVRNNGVCTYEQERRGFSYLYCKRKVAENGIDTSPLKITLTPIIQKDEEEEEASDQDLIDLLASNFEDV